MAKGNLYITPGSITRISADIIAASTDRSFSKSGGGLMLSAFHKDIPEFESLFNELVASKKGQIQESCSVFWLPLKNNRPHGIVVAIPTGGEIEPEKRSSQVVKAILNCAKEHLSDNNNLNNPPLIALPAFLTGHGGFWHDPSRVAIHQIEAAFEFTQQNDIDVVFVTYADHIYKAWIEARRKLLGDLQANSVNENEQLVDTIKSGECALFIGSGLSINSGLPGWGALIDTLSKELDIPNELNRSDMDYFLDLAQWYRDAGMKPSIEERVAEIFSVGRAKVLPSLAHYLVCSLPVRFFITTNYDDLIEYALETLRKYPIKIVSNQDAALTGGLKGSYVIKLHGSATDSERIILSRDDYEDFHSSRQALALLLESLLLNQMFLFLGYGLRDPDFRSINHRISKILQDAKRSAYAVTFDTMKGYHVKQWANKNIQMYQITGVDVKEQSRNFNKFLDNLLEKVFENEVRYLSKRESRLSEPVCKDLWENISKSADKLLEAISSIEHVKRPEVLAIASTMSHFASLGWRGYKTGNLSELLVKISNHVDLIVSDRIQLLITALKYCENASSAEEIKKMITKYEMEK